MNGTYTLRRVLGVQATGQRCVSPCWSVLGRQSVQKRHVLVYTELKQDKMTVLQYAHAFESYLAQLGDYDESYYLVAFYFWTSSRNNERRIYSAARITPGSKEYG